jgi:replication initiation protein RepC
MKHVHSGDPEGRQPSRSPTGLRRITPAMLPTEQIADGFAGGDFTPGQALAAFKAAGPYLGIAPRAVHAIDWLFRFTQVQDWQPGARPIVWPSAVQQGEALGLSLSQSQRLNRHLVEMGLIAMRDSPNGKRYGRRDRRGRIIEAYGFDLSPIAARIEEFRASAEAGRAERDAVARLRRRATIARNSLRQTWETFAEQAIAYPALPDLKNTAITTSQALRGLGRSGDLAPCVEALEDVAASARRVLEIALARRSHADQPASQTVEMRPMGRTDAAHITTTNQLSNPTDTVMALNKCSRAAIPEDYGSGHWRDQVARGQGSGKVERLDRGTVITITPDELIRLAPRLKTYLRRPSPSWPEIVEAADWLRHELGISKPLWADACLAMGRERSAIAVAIVSAKPAKHFKTSPGGYFNGMVAKARSGNLNIGRTIWGIRSNNASKPVDGHIRTGA